MKHPAAELVAFWGMGAAGDGCWEDRGELRAQAGCCGGTQGLQQEGAIARRAGTQGQKQGRSPSRPTRSLAAQPRMLLLIFPPMFANLCVQGPHHQQQGESCQPHLCWTLGGSGIGDEEGCGYHHHVILLCQHRVLPPGPKCRKLEQQHSLGEEDGTRGWVTLAPRAWASHASPLQSNTGCGASGHIPRAPQGSG